jgi:hypothetical protein
MQDFTPFTPELMGALSGPQTPNGKKKKDKQLKIE